jgi:hypothetical protein
VLYSGSIQFNSRPKRLLYRKTDICPVNYIKQVLLFLAASNPIFFISVAFEVITIMTKKNILLWDVVWPKFIDVSADLTAIIFYE